jgi:hypothetical protein
MYRRIEHQAIKFKHTSLKITVYFRDIFAYKQSIGNTLKHGSPGLQEALLKNTVLQEVLL